MNTAFEMYLCSLTKKNSLAISVVFLAAIHSFRLQAAFLEASASSLDGSKKLSSIKIHQDVVQSGNKIV